MPVRRRRPSLTESLKGEDYETIFRCLKQAPRPAGLRFIPREWGKVIRGLIKDPMICELDALFLAGHVGERDVLGHLEHSPDYHEWYRNFLDQAEHFFEEFFLPYFAKHARHDGTPVDLIRTWFDFLDAVITDLNRCVLSADTDTRSYHYLGELALLLMQNIFFMFFAMYLDEAGGWKAEMQYAIRSFEERYGSKAAHVGRPVRSSAPYADNLIRVAVAASRFGKLHVNDFCQRLEADEALAEDQVSFGELQAAAEFKKLRAFTKVMGPFQIKFLADGRRNAAYFRPSQIAEIRVEFLLHRDGYLQLVVDRQTGDILFLDTQKELLTVFNEHTEGMRRFKRLVYNALYDYFAACDLDPELIGLGTLEVEAVLHATTEELEESLDDAAVVTPRRRPLKPVEEFALLGRLCGTPVRQLLRAFTRLLGPVDRVSGSHHIFTSTLTGRKVIVPHHGSRDLKKGTMASILKAAGLTASQVVEEL